MGLPGPREQTQATEPASWPRLSVGGQGPVGLIVGHKEPNPLELDSDPVTAERLLQDRSGVVRARAQRKDAVLTTAQEHAAHPAGSRARGRGFPGWSRTLGLKTPSHLNLLVDTPGTWAALAPALVSAPDRAAGTEGGPGQPESQAGWTARAEVPLKSPQCQGTAALHRHTLMSCQKQGHGGSLPGIALCHCCHLVKANQRGRLTRQGAPTREAGRR